MTNYGNSTDLGYLITSISDSVSSNLKSYALEIADTWVNSQVSSVSTSSVPDSVEKAATFKAYAYLLHNLYDTSDGISPIAGKFEEEAEKLLASYINQTDSTDYDSPYSHSLTPTSQYSGRDKKTTYDDTDYQDQDDTKWESE